MAVGMPAGLLSFIDLLESSGGTTDKEKFEQTWINHCKTPAETGMLNPTAILRSNTACRAWWHHFARWIGDSDILQK